MNPKVLITYGSAAWLSMSLMGYGIAIRRYAESNPTITDQAMLISSGGSFLFAGALLIPAVALIHIGVKRLRLSPRSTRS